MTRTLIFIFVLALAMVSCRENVSESQIAVQVGKSVLLSSEVKTNIPLGLSGTDSLNYANEYIEEWVEQHLMYEQGLRNLPDIDKLIQQANDYRHELIASNFENQLVAQRMTDEISEEESMEFYKKHEKYFRLDKPLILGVYIKLLRNSSKVSEVKKWLKQLDEGNTDCVEEFEQYGLHRAVEYDNFFETWTDIYRLTDKLPVTVVDAASFLKRKTYEMKDDSYYYLFVIRDFRLAGDIAPYEYAKQDIFDMMVAQRRKTVRRQIIDEMKQEAERSGLLKRSCGNE